MDELDTYWADISAVFGLGELFGPPLAPGCEVPLSLSEKTYSFLRNDKEMAIFVEDFVLDSYNIILREEIVPKFWSNFVGEEESTKAGFHKFCRAVDILHSDVKRLAPALEELQRVREAAGSHRTVWAARTVAALFCAALRGTLHSQLETAAGWQKLVKQFYNQSFSCYYKEPWHGADTSIQSADDSGDWPQDISCGGCGQQAESCQCQSLIMEFNLSFTRMSELGVLDELAVLNMEIVQEKINSHVQETCKYNHTILKL